MRRGWPYAAQCHEVCVLHTHVHHIAMYIILYHIAIGVFGVIDVYCTSALAQVKYNYIWHEGYWMHAGVDSRMIILDDQAHQ